MQTHYFHAIHYLSKRFKDYHVACRPRPDGGIVLNLNCGNKQLFCYAIGHAELRDERQLNGIVEKIHRELALSGRAVTIHQVDWLRKRIELPTFFPGRKWYRERKVVKAGTKLRARAQR